MASRPLHLVSENRAYIFLNSSSPPCLRVSMVRYASVGPLGLVIVMRRVQAIVRQTDERESRQERHVGVRIHAFSELDAVQEGAPRRAGAGHVALLQHTGRGPHVDVLPLICAPT